MVEKDVSSQELSIIFLYLTENMECAFISKSNGIYFIQHDELLVNFHQYCNTNFTCAIFASLIGLFRS